MSEEEGVCERENEMKKREKNTATTLLSLSLSLLPLSLALSSPQRTIDDVFGPERHVGGQHLAQDHRLLPAVPGLFQHVVREERQRAVVVKVLAVAVNKRVFFIYNEIGGDTETERGGEFFVCVFAFLSSLLLLFRRGFENSQKKKKVEKENSRRPQVRRRQRREHQPAEHKVRRRLAAEVRRHEPVRRRELRLHFYHLPFAQEPQPRAVSDVFPGHEEAVRDALARAEGHGAVDADLDAVEGEEDVPGFHDGGGRGSGLDPSDVDSLEQLR